MNHGTSFRKNEKSAANPWRWDSISESGGIDAAGFGSEPKMSNAPPEGTEGKRSDFRNLKEESLFSRVHQMD
jgi:hypothetical protein